MSKRTPLVIFFIVLLVLVVSLFWWIYAAFFAVSKNPTMADILKDETRIEIGKGEVLLVREGREEAITEKGVLQKNDRVIAKNDAEAVIYWPDGALSRVKGPADIQILESSVNEALDTTIDVQVTTGEIWTKAIDMVTEESSFTVRSKQSIASIRGTQLYQKIGEDTEVISVYQHGIDYEFQGEKKHLLNGEDIEITRGKLIQQTRVSTQNPWIKEMQRQDEEYGKILQSERTEKLKKLQPKLEHARISEEELISLLENTELSPDEKFLRIEALSNTLVGDIKIAAEEGKNVETKRKAKMLSAIYDTYISTVQMSPEREKLLPKIVKLMTLQQKVLFAEKTPEDLIELRVRLGLARTNLLADSPELASLQMQRQLFFVEDLVREGKSSEAKLLFRKLSEFDRVSEPDWNRMPPLRKQMMQHFVEKLKEQFPDMREDMQEFSRRMFEKKESDTKVNTLSVEGNMNQNEVLPVKSTIKNMNENRSIQKTTSTVIKSINNNINATNNVAPVKNTNTSTVSAPVNTTSSTNTSTTTTTVKPTIVDPVPSTTTTSPKPTPAPTPTPVPPRGVYTPAP